MFFIQLKWLHIFLKKNNVSSIVLEVHDGEEMMFANLVEACVKADMHEGEALAKKASQLM